MSSNPMSQMSSYDPAKRDKNQDPHMSLTPRLSSQNQPILKFPTRNFGGAVSSHS